MSLAESGVACSLAPNSGRGRACAAPDIEQSASHCLPNVECLRTLPGNRLFRIEIKAFNENFYANEIRIGKSMIDSIVLALLELRRLRGGGFKSTGIGFL
jgi:hypothetical protein